MWSLQASPLFSGNVLDSWLGHNEYCVALDSDAYLSAPWRWPRNVTADEVGDDRDAACVSYVSVYCAALYWAILLTTNTGYHNLKNTVGAGREQAVTMVVIGCSQVG
jgi:hypothetical protein